MISSEHCKILKISRTDKVVECEQTNQIFSKPESISIFHLLSTNMLNFLEVKFKSLGSQCKLSGNSVNFSIPIYWPTFPANFVYSVVERLCDLMHLKMRLESILQAEGQGAC